MGAHHDHHSAFRQVSRKLTISTVLTVLFVGIEISAALYANSIALLGDAFHNFTDTMALLLALWAVRLERLPATRVKSFGYHRAGVLAAFVNAVALLALTAYLLYETFDRLRHPEEVDIATMLGVSIVALALNSFITLWLRKEGRHDMAVQSAVLHMFADALASLGVIIGAVLIAVTGSPIFDPIISLIIAVMIIWSSWGIVRESVNLLLEGTPSGIDPEAVARDLAGQDGVYGVHHLHIWALGAARPALSCHLMLGDVSLRSAGEVLERAIEMLGRKYHIAHTTIQLEYASCALDDPYCVPAERVHASVLD
jgi:cobalt-zinc-cadmium efflux system protein